MSRVRGGGGSKNRKNESTSIMDGPLALLFSFFLKKSLAKSVMSGLNMLEYIHTRLIAQSFSCGSFKDDR